jgi:ribosome maturation factor RimP
MDATLAQIWELAAAIAETDGKEIVDIEFHPEGSRSGRVLRVYIDKPGGTSLEELTQVSRQLSEQLDTLDLIESAYTLEVSSPGINRPLRRPEHFTPFIGKRIRVRTRDMIEGRRSCLGILQEAGADKIKLMQDRAEYEIPFSTIEKSNYEHDWSA